MRSLLGEITKAIGNKATKSGPPVPYSGRRSEFGGIFSSTGANTDREAQAGAMSANGVLFAIIGGIAIDVSGVEWHLFREAKSGKDEDREPVTQHAAWDVFNNPNPFFSRQEMFEVIEQHLGATGEGWPLLSRHSRFDWPVEWWPVYPHRMSPVPDPDKFLARYIYTSPDGEKVPLEVRDVALMRQPHPLDLMRGLSGAGAISVDLEAGDAARTWNRNFFLNSAQPGGVIEVERHLSDDEYDEMVTRWREQHQGVANAHRVAILEHGKWVDRKYTMRDMEFTALRGMSDEQVRKAFRYPKSLLGDTDTVNRAVAVAQEAMYAKTHLVPRLNRWKGMLNRKFLPAFGATAQGLVFDFVSPIPADEEAENAARQSKATAAKTYVEAGWPRKAVAEALELPKELVEAAETADAKADERAAVPVSPAPGQQPAPGADPAEDMAWRQIVTNLTNAEPEPVEPVEPVEPQPGEPDYEELQSQWALAVAALLLLWPGLADGMVSDLVAQVRELAEADDWAALGTLVVDADVVAAIGDRIAVQGVGVAAQAAAGVVGEAAAQGVTVESPAEPGAGRVIAVAAAVAGVIAAGYATAAARKALQVAGLAVFEVAAAVREALVEMGAASRGWVADNLGAAMSAAQSAGRVAVMQAAVDAGRTVRLIARETNDARQCAVCAQWDGHEFSTLDDALKVYNIGNVGCLGGLRCRGALEIRFDS